LRHCVGVPLRQNPSTIMLDYHRTRTPHAIVLKPLASSHFFNVFFHFFLFAFSFVSLEVNVGKLRIYCYRCNVCCFFVVLGWQDDAVATLWAFIKVVIVSYSWKTYYNFLLDLDSCKLFSMQTNYCICGCASLLPP